MAITYEYVGKTGGGGKPFETVFTNVESGFTINLPSGEWGLVFQFSKVTWNGSQTVRLYVDGVEVGNIGGSGSSSLRSENASIMVRHQTGSLDITLSSSDGRVNDMAVVAFPDPTP